MKFSFIIGTLNRPEAIKCCIESLFQQTYTDYEIVIIDQSDDDITEKYINELNSKLIKYKHVDYKGLSKARNDALKTMEGDYFCLIDDDGYYDEDYLKNAVENMKDSRTILSGYIWDTIKESDFVKYNAALNGKGVSINDILRTCPSAALVFPAKIIDEIGYFDERFGAGGIYPSAEETDFIIRALDRGYEVVYVNSMKLQHPIPKPTQVMDPLIDKLATYYIGFGALYKKHYLLGKNKLLKKPYQRMWIKLYIKKLLFFKFNPKDTNKLIKGFKRGLNGYVASE